MPDERDEDGPRTILERVITREVPGAVDAHVEGDYAFVLHETDVVWRFLLSPEAKRVALLEREGRYKDIRPGRVRLLPVPSDESG